MNIKHSQRKSEKIILPEVGEVLLDENGEVEVPDEIGATLVQGKNWVDTAAKIDDLDGSEVDAASSENPEESEDNDAEKAKLIEMIKTLPHDELLKLAQDAKINGVNLFKKPEKIEALRKLVIRSIQKAGK